MYNMQAALMALVFQVIWYLWHIGRARAFPIRMVMVMEPVILV